MTQPKSSASSQATGNGSTKLHTPPVTRATSPYGTRSRNRGAANRVNYAEDKDNEMEYEYTNPSASSTTTNSAAHTNQSGGHSAVNGVGGRRASGVVTTTGKEVAVAAHGSKKRKNTVVQPKERISNMYSFENPFPKDGVLTADDGTTFTVNDHIYLICEPPGEPYYLARIMEFLHIDNNPTKPIDSLRVNWYYRPKDIHRKVTDSRTIFASMHSDPCPLSSIRGKCTIEHKNMIDDIDEFRKQQNHFWYDKLFDRYIQRFYEVIPTRLVLNVPEKVRKVLQERWKFVLVEPQRAKELCSAMKECKRCNGYCASADSVHCAVCGNSYHMNCVRPPLLKKPSRGFAWACGPCNRSNERRLEARNTPTQINEAEDEPAEDEDEEMSQGGAGAENRTPAEAETAHQPTEAQLALAKQWPYRYLGMHCNVEDVLDYDDRIYPMAASRLGSRHQANVTEWHGRPVEYVKPLERKKYEKGRRKDAKTAAALAEAERLEREKRPKWVMDEPAGYVKRGEDESTATLMFRISEDPAECEDVAKMEIREKIIDDYMEKAKGLAKSIGVEPNATNFLDKALQLLYQHHLKIEPALKALKTVDKKKDLKEPEFKGEELKRFEEGVAKYGSELHDVYLHVKTKKMADIVRFYYMWKKTPRGKEIWGGYEGRRAKKEAKKQDGANATSVTGTAAAKLVDEFADDHDDSAFDEAKAIDRKRGFQCKFCFTRHSRQWRRAPGVAPGTTVPATGGSSKHSKKEDKEKAALVLALCYRCAELWRRYGLQWEDPDEIMKKLGQGGGRAWKRRIDEELLKEIAVAAEEKKDKERGTPASQAGGSATPTAASSTAPTPSEPPKKKQKTTETAAHGKKARERSEKKEVAQPPPPPPPPPEPPKPKMVSCMICSEVGPEGEKHLCCRDCKMTVHRTCYGVGEIRSANKWVCDMCINDKNPQTSTCYECVLCPVRGGDDEEESEKVKEKEKEKPTNTSHKKKEKEKATHAGSDRDERRMKDADKHKPHNPREALKSTAGNNWVHVVCAVWTPEIKFGDSSSLSPAEGIGLIPQSRHQQVCTVCKTSKGACVTCHQCHTPVHVGCAQKAGYTFGFDLQPVKNSRRDVANTVKIGTENGSLTAALWCPEHDVKGKVHGINEKVTETGQTALQLFVSTYKQADLTLTGTVRKASLITQSTKASQSSRRTSIASPATAAPVTRSSISVVTIKPEPTENGVQLENGEEIPAEPATKCHKCGVDVSPFWRKVRIEERVPQVNGVGSQSPLVNGNGHIQGSRASSISSLTTPSPSTSANTNGDMSQQFTIKEKFVLECHRCHWKAAHAPTPPPPPPPPPPPAQPAPPVPLQSVQPPQHTPPVVSQPSPRVSQMPPLKQISLSPPVYQPALPAPISQIPPITPMPPITSQIPHVSQPIPPPPATVPPERPALPIHPSHHSPPFLPHQHHPYPPVGQGTQLPPIKGALPPHGPNPISSHPPQQPPPMTHVHSVAHSVPHGVPHSGTHTTPHSTTHPGPQHPGPQHPGPQHPGPQHPGPQHPGPQHPGPQHPGTQHPGTQHPGPQHPGPQHPASQHPGPQHPGPQHPGSQHPGPQHPGPQHPGPQHHAPQHHGPQHIGPHPGPHHGQHSGIHSAPAPGHGSGIHGSPPVQSVPHTPQQGYARPNITSPHHGGSIHTHGSPHGVVSLPHGSPPHSRHSEIRHNDMRHTGSPQHPQGHMPLHHSPHPMHSSSSIGHPPPPQQLPPVSAPHQHPPPQTLPPYHSHHSNPPGPMHQPIGHHGPLHPQHHVPHSIHQPQHPHREHSQPSHNAHPPQHHQHPPPPHQQIQHIKREEPPPPQPAPQRASAASGSASLANLLH